MTTNGPAAQTISDYAAEHGLDPADMVAIIAGDPDPETPVGDDPHHRVIRTWDGWYLDASYETWYLDLVAQSVQPEDDER